MSYPHFTTPAPHDSAAAPRANESPRQRIERRLREVQLEIVEACARVIDKVGRPDESPALALADERRQFANMLHAAKFCHRRACRRRHSCQGEPTRCLAVLLPAIGFDRATELIASRKRTRRRRAQK